MKINWVIGIYTYIKILNMYFYMCICFIWEGISMLPSVYFNSFIYYGLPTYFLTFWFSSFFPLWSRVHHRPPYLSWEHYICDSILKVYHIKSGHVLALLTSPVLRVCRHGPNSSHPYYLTPLWTQVYLVCVNLIWFSHTTQYH